VIGIRMRDEGEGVRVISVQPGSPAEQAGVRPGDWMISLEGQAIRDGRGLLSQMGSMKSGQDVSFEVRRNGQSQAMSAQLTTFREAFGDQHSQSQLAQRNPAGNGAKAAPPKAASSTRLPSGESPRRTVARPPLNDNQQVDGQQVAQMQQEINRLKAEVQQLRAQLRQRGDTNQPQDRDTSAPQDRGEQPNASDAQDDAEDAATPEPPADKPAETPAPRGSRSGNPENEPTPRQDDEGDALPPTPDGLKDEGDSSDEDLP
jgi:hypothetical protein